jgi:PKD repeat protein
MFGRDNGWRYMKKFMKWVSVIVVLTLFFVILAMPVTAYTTEVTVQRYAADGLTPINETSRTYQWMKANLQVYGDGSTHYFSQGPTFNESDYWDNTEWQNVASRDWGAVMGTDLKDLCDLVGGGSPGRDIRVSGSDLVGRDFSYASVYHPDPRQGPMIVAWKKDGMYPDSGYDEGMRLIMLADAKVNTFGWNTSGWHVFGNADMRDAWQPEYWYNYSGKWPSAGGTSVQTIRYIRVFTSDPVPPPSADFSADVRIGHLINGNFETGSFPPWTGNSMATIHTGSAAYRKGNASVKLAPPVGGSAWIEQNADLTNVAAITLWRQQFGGPGKYVEVLVDSTVIANYTETSPISNKYESIDITKFGFTGTHTVKVNAVNGGSSTFTTYVDEIFDFGPGTSGLAPLTIQFKDLSAKMEDTIHTSWAWDFQNDGSTDSTVQNPLYTYPVNGTYTVNLTVTNAGGSTTLIRDHFITCGTPPPVAHFTVDKKNGTVPLTVQFTDLSTGTISSRAWDFENDGVIDSSQKDPVHTFTQSGVYSVNLTVFGPGGKDSEIMSDILVLSQPVIALPGYVSVPTDPDHDGIYEDLNGNRRLDFADVVLYFNQMEWIAAHEPVRAFDLNGNGRIDFADIVKLFGKI